MEYKKKKKNQAHRCRELTGNSQGQGVGEWAK